MCEVDPAIVNQSFRSMTCFWSSGSGAKHAQSCFLPVFALARTELCLFNVLESVETLLLLRTVSALPLPQCLFRSALQALCGLFMHSTHVAREERIQYMSDTITWMLADQLDYAPLGWVGSVHMNLAQMAH